MYRIFVESVLKSACSALLRAAVPGVNIFRFMSDDSDSGTVDKLHVLPSASITAIRLIGCVLSGSFQASRGLSEHLVQELVMNKPTRDV